MCQTGLASVRQMSCHIMLKLLLTFFLPLDKLITWLFALKVIIAAFSANFVCV